SGFLDAGFPKTTGPELFNLEYLQQAQERSETLTLSKEDVMATLCRFSAEVIVNAIKKCFGKDAAPSIYISGGGIHNPLLLTHLKIELKNAVFHTTERLEINPDAKEAILFAILANETLAGDHIDFGNREGIPSVCMGKICLP